MQNLWRRAGANFGTVGRLAVVSVAAALLAAAVVLPVVGIIGVATRDAANTFNTLEVGKLGTPPARSELLDSEGKVIAYFYPNDIYRVPVKYSQISPVMRNAIVAIEDDNFYHEGALDFRGTIRALASDEEGSQTQGGSTLAQQYVKNVRLLKAGNNHAAQVAAANDEQGTQGITRKIQELRIASNIEHQMSPHQLLAAYLNVAYYSNHAWGIQVAAEVYFSKPASRLTLPEAALLAGMVQAPTQYNPLLHPQAATERRNQVLNRMAQLHYITQAVANHMEAHPTRLKLSSAPLQTGCTSPQAKDDAFFCNYVQNVLQHQYKPIWRDINTTGGLKIYTTMNMKDQLAAERAVNFIVPPHSSVYNPNHNAAAEVLIKPGTGQVKAIAVDRTFGRAKGDDDIDFAVNSNYGGGGLGVQTGSSSKIFTLIAALDKGYPFGHSIKVKSPTTVAPYFNCKGGETAPYTNLFNAEGPQKGTQIWQLFNATDMSINVYFAHLEQQVGLCYVVKTAAKMGMTRADGVSLLKNDPKLGRPYSNDLSADNYASFTLGSVYVSPMDMAAAYASVAARGMYCHPEAISKIVSMSGQVFPVRSAKCHRDMSKAVADAANDILQGVITDGTATGPYNRSIGRPAAAKTGTANDGYYAAFAGYTPSLAGYVSVFNPVAPTVDVMKGQGSCYREVAGDLQCPGQMFGDYAPGAVWQMTFEHAILGPPRPFVGVPADSPFFSEGSGQGAPKIVGGHKPKPPKGGKHGPPTPPPPGH